VINKNEVLLEIDKESVDKMLLNDAETWKDVIGILGLVPKKIK